MRFCDNHVKNGITAGDGGVALFPLMVGFRRSKEILMLGEPISGKEAADIGLINRSVPDAELDRTVDEYADKLAAGVPQALAWTKLSLNTLLKQTVLDAFETSIAYDMRRCAPTMSSRARPPSSKSYTEVHRYLRSQTG